MQKYKRIIKNKIILLLLLDAAMLFAIFALGFFNMPMPEFFIFSCFFSGLISGFLIYPNKTWIFIRNEIISAVFFSACLGIIFTISEIGYGPKWMSALEYFLRSFSVAFFPAFILFFAGVIVRLSANKIASF